MFTLLSILLALVTLSYADYGWADEPIYPIRSDPFNLILVSEDASLNGNTLSACHTGVTDSSLCPTHSDGYALEPAVLYHNTSDHAITNDFGTTGILAWWIPFGLPIPAALIFETQPMVSLSIAILAMTFSGDSSISFDKDDFMNVQDGIDWTADQPGRTAYKGYYRWWVCYTFQGTGYVRRNLVLGTSGGKPDTPSCVKVQVKRVFVEK